MTKHPEELVEKAALAIARTMGGWNEDITEPEMTGPARQMMEAHWAKINEKCLELGRVYAIAALDVLEEA